LYARDGVKEYWLADPINQQFRPFTLTPDGYQPISLDGTIFRSLVLPGFEFDVDALFANLDAP
jgi:Uma2 family endonuclease